MRAYCPIILSACSAWLLGACAVVAQDVTLHFEPPDAAVGHDILWSIHQDGQVMAFGTIECRDASPKTTTNAVRRGPAMLWATVNRDDHRSSFPSFGDLYQQIAFEVRADGTTVTATRDGWHERAATRPDNVLTVHYHRYDRDYTNAGLWTWDEHLQRMPAAQEFLAVGRDMYGAVFQLDIGDYGKPGDRVGLLPRLNSDWAFKDGGDRFWSPEMGREVYLLQDDNNVYTQPPDTRPKLVGARIDAQNVITVAFNRPVRVEEFPPQRFSVRGIGDASQDGTLAVRNAAPVEAGAWSRALRLEPAEPLDFLNQRYEVVARDLGTLPAELGDVLADPKLFYDPDAKLGATYAKEATTFRVFAPTAREVSLRVDPDPMMAVAASIEWRKQDQLHTFTMMQQIGNGIWEVSLPNELVDLADHDVVIGHGHVLGQYYSFSVLFEDEATPERMEAPDIYSVCNTGRGGRGLIVDLDATDPPGFDPTAYAKLASPVDAVIYELHVRDFTIAANSGVTHKGKFLGLTEPGTRLPDDSAIKTGLDHLVELGVTHVQLMPIQDFDNDETSDEYNWGYMPVSYNSPDGWYATVPVGPQRITEFKQLVHALHQRGIGVIMDVVYNHAAPNAAFETLAPGYYFRRRPDGSFWNGSGCGNEFASERPMARKFMLDSLKFWVTEYGIDGFRFDLMGLHDLETMLHIRDELRAINPSVLVYGEPWAAGPCGLPQVTDQRRISGTGIAAFNDHMRDAIKGDRDGGAPGFIQVGDRLDSLRRGIVAAVDHRSFTAPGRPPTGAPPDAASWAAEPVECITYCEAHDNLTTWDKLLQSAPDAPVEAKRRMQRFAGLLVLTSQGIPFLHSGQELCRTKGGSSNSYNLPDAVNQIDWSWKQQHRDVYEYYRGLIALRRAHAAFRLRTADEIRRRITLLPDAPSPKCLAYTIDGRGLTGESCSTLLVLLNGDAADQPFPLPPGTWQVLANADRAGTEPLATTSGSMTLPAHSGAVLGRSPQP